MSIDLAQLDLPDEVCVKDAAHILDVDRKTVLGYIIEGVLPARNAALPSSKRPLWRLRLRDVLELRTDYVRHEPTRQSKSESQKRRPTPQKYVPKILKRK